MSSQNSHIRLENLSKHYQMGDTVVKALDDVSLEIKSGDLMVVQGPSGAGKTTFLNMVGGIASPTSGSLSVFGENIEKYSAASLAKYRRNKIGFVFQFFNLFPNLNALENVEIALEMVGDRKKVREVALEYLKAVGLEDRIHHFPYQLSGGQQQRVTIARALAKQPFTDGNFLILCDEPTGNLDEATGNKILDLIKEMNEHYKTTFLVVTHNPKMPDILKAKSIEIRDGKIY